MNVIDENDNSPMFQVSGVVVLTVSEGEDIGQALFTAEAIDVDEGSNSQVNYFLQEGDGTYAAYLHTEICHLPSYAEF